MKRVTWPPAASTERATAEVAPAVVRTITVTGASCGREPMPAGAASASTRTRTAMAAIGERLPGALVEGRTTSRVCSPLMAPSLPTASYCRIRPSGASRTAAPEDQWRSGTADRHTPFGCPGTHELTRASRSSHFQGHGRVGQPVGCLLGLPARLLFCFATGRVGLVVASERGAIACRTRRARMAAPGHRTRRRHYASKEAASRRFGRAARPLSSEGT
jgi:hypothetical protein